jgi:serine protease
VESDGGATALRNAISLARAQNVMLVAAAGNSNAYTAYPAIYSNVFAVGALDHLGGKASYSNYGKLELSAPGGDLDQYCACLAAPAGCNWEVWSLSGTYPACSQPNSVTYTCALANGVEGGAGTSFSAPLVAAAAALLFSQDPALHVEEVSQRLMQSALPTSAGPGWHSSTGWGKLNFYGALTQPLAAGNATVLKAWNSPNPFSPGRDAYTTLTFVLPAPAPVSLKLYDGGGELVKAWELGADGTFAGMNMLNWDGRNGTGMAMANGAYLLVLESGGARAINRVAVLR